MDTVKSKLILFPEVPLPWISFAHSRQRFVTKDSSPNPVLEKRSCECFFHTVPTSGHVRLLKGTVHYQTLTTSVPVYIVKPGLYPPELIQMGVEAEHGKGTGW